MPFIGPKPADTVLDTTLIGDGTVTKAKLATDAKTNITDDGTEGTKVAAGTTGQRGSTAGQFRYNSTTGKFEGRNASSFVALEPTPVVSSVNVSNITQKQIDDGFDLVITGQNFASGDVAKFIANDDTEFTSPTTTVNSATQITARVTSTIDATKEPYKVSVTSAGGLTGSLASAFNIDAAPVWTTAAGNIGSLEEGDTANITIAASDAEGDTIAYTETGGSVLTSNGFNLNSSTGVIGGTAPNVSGSATFSFTARATSGTNITDRAFNIIVSDAPSGGNSTGTYSYGGTTYSFHKFTSDGNFVIGANKTVDIFMIGGGGGSGGDNSGGGGSGGLIWRPSLALTAGTYAIVIGSGGTGTTAGSQGSSTQGGNSTFGSLLTALGGGYGGSANKDANDGGSGGGGGRYGPSGTHSSATGTGVQTTDSSISADSRTYGFGFNGGDGRNDSEGPGGGGGGTGAVGSNASSGTVGNGGVGNSTFISSSAAATTAFLLGTVSGTDSSNAATTSSSSGTLYIGGGGSGGTQDRSQHSGGGSGGLGGGANIGGTNGNNGLINTGSGGSGNNNGSNSGGNGGTGLVIVRYS